MHEEYVDAIEKYLHNYMQNAFEEKIVDQFYKDFTTNFNDFYKMNEDAYTVMKGMIDFQEFKK